jgi:hypothetical protein
VEACAAVHCHRGGAGAANNEQLQTEERRIQQMSSTRKFGFASLSVVLVPEEELPVEPQHVSAVRQLAMVELRHCVPQLWARNVADPMAEGLHDLLTDSQDERKEWECIKNGLIAALRDSDPHVSRAVGQVIVAIAKLEAWPAGWQGLTEVLLTPCDDPRQALGNMARLHSLVAECLHTHQLAAAAILGGLRRLITAAGVTADDTAGAHDSPEASQLQRLRVATVTSLVGNLIAAAAPEGAAAILTPCVGQLRPCSAPWHP